MNAKELDVMKCEKFVSGIGRKRWLCKWWIRVKPCAAIMIDGLWSASSEIYVPWWAWPFEIIHRMIFGSSKIDIEGHND